MKLHIEINDALLIKAKKLTGIQSDMEAIEKALKMLIDSYPQEINLQDRLANQAKILELMGKS